MAGWVLGGCVLVRNISPTSSSNPGFSSPKQAAITTALSRPRVKECRSLRTVSLFVEEVSHWRQNDGSPIQTTFSAPTVTTASPWPWPLRPTSVYGHNVFVMGTNTWKSHDAGYELHSRRCYTFRCTYRSYSCTVRAICERELSLNTMALLVSKVVWRFWRSPNQCSSVVGISGYFNTETLQECGSGLDEDVTDGSATPTAARRVLCNRGSVDWCFNGMQAIAVSTTSKSIHERVSFGQPS